MRRCPVILLTLVAIILGSPSAVIANTEIKRHVLALFKASEGDTAGRNQTSALLEQPLESLGLVVDYADPEKGLPAAETMDKYLGVVTFFRGPVMTDARGYLGWLNRQALAGRKVVILGEIGAMQDRDSRNFVSHAELSRALVPLGIRFDGLTTNDATRLQLLNASPQMSYEEPFTTSRLRSYERVRALSPGATQYLSITRTDLADGDSSPVITTTNGGYAGRDFLLYEYEQGGLIKQRWHLDPFAFLSTALGVVGTPRMDAASLNGRRLWMAHIDGDGLITPAGAGLLCGQVILDRILKVYRMPISVSVVSSDLDKDPRALELAKQIFSLPHVEPASHSASHPMDWSAPDIDLGAELEGSIKSLAERAVPVGKSIALFTWSGLCNPPAAALERLASMRVASINGANTEGGFVNRLDRLFPSRSFLAPMTRLVGGERQISHRAANDYDLTDGWKVEKRAGYEGIIETFERTAERPEIPAHAYFHFYSGESPDSLRALQSVLGWAKRNRVAPVFVSDYVKLVDDFRSAKIFRTADGRTQVENAGACRTVIFPDTEKTVDFSRSLGVVGFSVRQNRLYVFLDGATRHTIALSDSAPPFASLASATGWVDVFTASHDQISLEVRAFGKTEVALRIPSAGAYAIEVISGSDKTGARPFRTAVATNEGLLTFTYTATGHDLISVRPTTQTAAAARRAGFPLLALSLAAFPVWTLVRTRRRLQP